MNPVNFCFIHTIVFIFLKSQYTSLKKEISLLEKHHILGFDEILLTNCDGRNQQALKWLNHPMELNIWRAPTDNDMYIKAQWKKAHYDEAGIRAYH